MGYKYMLFLSLLGIYWEKCLSDVLTFWLVLRPIFEKYSLNDSHIWDRSFVGASLSKKSEEMKIYYFVY